MAKRKQYSKPEGDEREPNLRVSRTEAEQKIQNQIGTGMKLLERLRLAVESTGVGRPLLDTLESEYKKWSEFNTELLRRLFDRSEISQKYEQDFVMELHPANEIENYQKRVQRRITHLESLLQRLPLFEEPQAVASIPSQTGITTSNRILVVHGRDEGSKEQVARLLEKLGLEAIILHEQPSGGQTIIEKIEAHSSVGYAVVLLTPDDKGGPASESAQNRRARQNVIFELGYFIGKLGRERVCPLYSDGVELPSDIHGVVYVPLDGREAWKVTLAKELRKAGFEVDLNRL